MNYEKKYKEALERAKIWQEHLYEVGDKDYADELNYIFPELKESDDEKIRRGLINGFNECLKSSQYPISAQKYWHNIKIEDIFSWLEKQGEQEQLYIRFGEIPTDEKSKIYRGEAEVGTENGVSVYPAFKTSEGNIVLGLNLPITKTTLYTQQHLIEYDDRPCYLVKGDYVGKDTDGQPLINNVSIIEKIGTYRVKEEKQGEQKTSVIDFKAKDWYVSKVDGKIHNIYNSVDKPEPKFNVGDWIIDNKNALLQVTKFEVDYGYELKAIDGQIFHFVSPDLVDANYHLWTIQDAKPGDVLVNGSNIFIFHFIKATRLMGYCHVNTDDGRFYYDIGKNECFCLIDAVVTPATNAQRDILFQKMKEAGYEWDNEKKELKSLVTNGGDFCESENCEQKPAKWSEEDERNLKGIIDEIEANKNNAPDYDIKTYDRFLSWLKSLRPQKQWKPSEEQLEALESATENCAYSEYQDCLRELLKQLKKLREE